MTDQTNTRDNQAADPLLGVRRSALGQAWALKPFVRRIAEAIAHQEGVSPIVGQLLAARGVDIDNAHVFLNPSLKDLMPDPSIILDMDAGTTRIANAIDAGEEIAIFGDYDVDGATSSAVLYRFLVAVGAKVRIYIPDRMVEGYGPNAPALLGLRDAGVTLAITVDCGTLSFEPLAEAKKAGLDVVVVDHHKAEPSLPEAVAVINPNRLDDESGLTQLAACGVAFLLAVSLNRALRDAGWYKDGRREPNLIALLDVVALGTVCDVVPLTGLNRAFVAQGLKVMGQRTNAGITALADVGRVSEAPGTYHAGFVLGPRLNAGGRVGESHLGARLLTTDSPMEANEIAEKLDIYNTERRDIEAGVLEAATAMAIQQYEGRLDQTGVMVLAADGWHAGVIGIVASRIKDIYGVPVFIIGIENGEGKGSGRSISGVDLGAAVIDAQAKGLLIKGGGHAMAAGFSIAPDKIDGLRTFFDERLCAATQQARQDRALNIDGVIALSGVTAELIDEIDTVGPFGMGNPGPRFAIPDVALVKADIVGKNPNGNNHVRAIFKSKDGKSIKAMAFRHSDSELGAILTTGIGRKFNIAGRVKKDTWSGGGAVEITLDDASLIGPP